MVRGRFATVAEERFCRVGGYLKADETVAFLLDYHRSPGRTTFAPESASVAYRISRHQIQELVSIDGIDYERAKRFSSKALSRRFASGKPYALTTLDAEEVLWAAICISFKARIGLNTKRLMHFRNSEGLQPLIDLGAIFYARAHSLVVLLPFREPVAVGRVRELEPLVEVAFGIERERVDGLRRSYVDENGEVRCVPGPHVGDLFDARTGNRLPDEAWAKTPVINPALLEHVQFEGNEPIWSGPNEVQMAEIIEAYDLTPSDRWGRRDPFSEEPGGRFALVIPGKIYGCEEDQFRGEDLTAHLYARQLSRGSEFFANVFEQARPRWLCVDFDVKALDLSDKSRISVDHAWIQENIDQEAVQCWEASGVCPEFRLSGRGFYIEFFFSERVSREELKSIAERTVSLIKSDRREFRKNQCVHVITPSGYRVIKDVTNLSHLVRLPGSVHHSAGFPSCYLDGSFVPPGRRSSPEGIERLL